MACAAIIAIQTLSNFIHADDPATVSVNLGGSDGHVSSYGLVKQSIAQTIVSDRGRVLVNPTGSLNYNYPIPVPAGRLGVQPHLSVGYISDGSNGSLGVGMHLSGFPYVGRIDIGEGVRHSNADTFGFNRSSLDTEISPDDALVPVDEPNRRYRTSKESWLDFIAFDCGAARLEGPCRWEMRDGKGNTYYFGGDASYNTGTFGVPGGFTFPIEDGPNNSIHRWLLYKVKDLHGNYYRIDYEVTGARPQVAYPTRITYTLDDSTRIVPGRFEIDFVYEPRSDASTARTGLERHTHRLRRIQVHSSIRTPTHIDRQLISQYSFRYVQSRTSGRSLLTEIQQLSATGNRLPPTRFEWAQDQPQSIFDRIEVTGSASPAAGDWSDLYVTAEDDRPARFLTGDVNGDGRDDLVAHFAGQRYEIPFRTTSNPLYIARGVDHTYIYYGAPDGLKPGVLIRSGTEVPPDSIFLSDVNRDGLADLVCVSKAGLVEIAFGAAAGIGQFSRQFDLPNVSSTHPGRRYRRRVLALDMNGDNSLDLFFYWVAYPVFNIRNNIAGGTHVPPQLYSDVYPPQGTVFSYALGNATAFTAPVELFTAHNPANGDVVEMAPFTPLYAFDINSDGNDDVIFQSPYDIFGPKDHDEHTPFWEALANPDPRDHGLHLFYLEGSWIPRQGMEKTRLNSNYVAPFLFQPLLGDINGDGVRDFVYLHRGYRQRAGSPHRLDAAIQAAELMGESVPDTDRFTDTEFSPEYQNLYFRYGVRNDRPAPSQHAWIAHAQFNSGFPGRGRSYDWFFESDDGIRTAGNAWDRPNATWQNHLGDVNGDGYDDLVSLYRGAAGERLDVILGSVEGLRSATSVVNRPSPLADGRLVDPQWESVLTDVNGDGRKDLIMAFGAAGDQNTYLQYRLGTAGGLGAEVSGMFANHGIIVDVLTADVNGDGLNDLIAPGRTPNDPIKFFLSRARAADRITEIQNELGGRYHVSYTPVGDVPGAIDPAGSACPTYTPRRNALCGGVDLRRRLLVTSVRTDNGRGARRVTRYEYRNGRFQYGPRKDLLTLGFETFVVIDGQTGQQSITDYYLDPPYERRVARQRINDGLGTRIFQEESSYDTVEARDAGLNVLTTFVRLRTRSSTSYEAGREIRSASERYAYDAYGQMDHVVSCVGQECTATDYDYSNFVGSLRAPDEPLWLLGRLEGVKTTGRDSRVVLSWDKWTHRARYPAQASVGGQFRQLSEVYEVIQHEQLQCGDGHTCSCTDRGVCTSDHGSTQFVVVQQNHAYEFGQLTRVDDTYRRTTSYTHDPTFVSYLASETRTSGTLTLGRRITYDHAGRTKTVADSNDVRYVYDYDEFGRPWTTTKPNGGRIQYSYVSYGNPQAQFVEEAANASVAADGSPTEIAWTRQYFDGFGQVYRTERPADERRAVVTDRDEGFDGLARYVTWSVPHYTDAPAAVFRITYDPQGRPSVIAKKYRDGSGRRLFQFGYGPGRALAVTNPRGHTTHYTYNERGQLLESKDATGSITKYAYDAAMRLARIQPASGGVIEYEYTGLGDVRTFTDPVRGTTRYAFLPDGKLSTITDALANVTTYFYDDFDRVRQASAAKAGTTPDSVFYHYDASHLPYSKGRLTSVNGPASSCNFEHDVMGNVTSRNCGMSGTIPGLPPSYHERYEFDFLGRVTQMSLPFGRVARYRYNRAGQLGRILLDGQVHTEFANHTANSQVGERTSGNVRSIYKYDEDDLLQNVRTVRAAEGLRPEQVHQDLTYTYDSMGNVTVITDKRPQKVFNGTDTNETQRFEYDPLDRLTKATGVYGVRTFRYDAIGNILQNGDVSYRYGPRSLSGSRSRGALGTESVFEIKYDDAGNTVSKMGSHGCRQYQYDARNRLTRIGDCASNRALIEYSYNHQGQRVAKTFHDANGKDIKTYYLSENYEIRVEGPGTPYATQTAHVTAPGMGRISTTTIGALNAPGVLPDVDSAARRQMVGTNSYGPPAGTWFAWKNHIGSSTTITDATGAKVAHYTHYPFGETDRSHSLGRDIVTHQFTGQDHDEEAGLMYFRSRFYDPALGRFLTPDSVTPGGGLNPQGLNRYAYVLNNPVNYQDPTGHDTFYSAVYAIRDAGWAVLGVFGSVLNVVARTEEFENGLDYHLEYTPGFREGFVFGTHMLDGLTTFLSLKGAADTAVLPQAPPGPGAVLASGGTRPLLAAPPIQAGVGLVVTTGAAIFNEELEDNLRKAEQTKTDKVEEGKAPPGEPATPQPRQQLQPWQEDAVTLTDEILGKLPEGRTAHRIDVRGTNVPSPRQVRDLLKEARALDRNGQLSEGGQGLAARLEEWLRRTHSEYHRQLMKSR